MPSVWGGDKSGHATTDPKVILKDGGLFPLGGPEETGKAFDHVYKKF